MARTVLSFCNYLRVAPSDDLADGTSEQDAATAISTALPCRISVYRDGDTYKLATIRPAALLKMFAAPGLDPVAREVEDVVTAMMLESA
jgi:uncharacterized protein (DUF302 family)